MAYARNPYLQNDMLPVDIVLGPTWWHRHEGITFDEDYFFHPAKNRLVEVKLDVFVAKRVESRQMGSRSATVR